MWKTILRLTAALALLYDITNGQSLRQPQVRIEAPPELSSVRSRLESADPNLLAGIVELVGLEDPGPVIQVVLATEGSSMAHQVAPWVAGFALGSSGKVVIFPARSPSYPHNSLQDVLRHEVAHVLIARAAGGETVPRWFNEGLAMAAERSWRFDDQTRFLYQLVLGPSTTFSETDALFAGDKGNQDRAYALSGAIVRELIQQFGATVAAQVLMRMRKGIPFEAAFADVTGVTVRQAESDFWRGQRVWTTWIPLLTSSAMVWMLVTLIAIVAIRKRRQKDAEMQKRWDEEETEL
jgi:Peptidase MA superfamily